MFKRLGFVAVLTACALSANAQPKGQSVCQPEATVKARMAAEGQMRLITGKRTTDKWNENVLTSNADGSHGYNIEFGDGKACIVVQYRNIHLADVTKPVARLSIPSWAILKYDRDAALRSCKSIGRGECGDHNDSIQSAFNHNQYVSFMAIAQKENPDGSLTDTGILTVTTDYDYRKGSLVTHTNPAGARQTQFTMIETEFTKLAAVLIARQRD